MGKKIWCSICGKLVFMAWESGRNIVVEEDGVGWYGVLYLGFCVVVLLIC